MKKIWVYCLIFLFQIPMAFSQWQWVKQFGGSGRDIINTKLNNTYLFVSGLFEYNCYLDSDTLYSIGYNDMFIAKYDLSGNNRLWIKQFGGNNNVDDYEWGSIKIITNDALYFSGTFTNTLIIDSFSVVDMGRTDAFLAKFDLNGNCIWIKSAGGMGIDESRDLAIDTLGNLYWAISMTSNGSVDSFPLNKGTAFVKLDANGNVQFIKNNLLTGGTINTFKIHNNEFYFTGYSENDTVMIDVDTLISNHNHDILLAKIDISGSVIWSKQFGGNNSDNFGNALEFDDNNNIYLAGRFNDTLIIDGNQVISNGNRDILFAKFNNNGTNIWIKNCQAIGQSGAWALSLARDSEGKFYVGGYFEGTAHFGNYVVTSNNFRYDMFLARYDENGDCLGVRNFGVAKTYNILVDANDDLYLAVNFINSVNINSTTYTSSGNEDALLIKCDGITGIGEESRRSDNTLTIYANPNKGTFRIKVPEGINSLKNTILIVYNNKGQEIAHFNLDDNVDKPQFNIENSAKGLYSVKLIQVDKVYSGKLVVE